MSRIGKKPIPLPAGVSAEVTADEIKVKGPKGQLARPVPPLVVVKVEGGAVLVEPTEGGRRAAGFWGLARTLVNNMVVGVSQGFERKLELVGVGYRAEAQGRSLKLSLGYSNPVDFALPEGIEATVDRTKITVSGIDKELLGQTLANIRGLRPPEPYKGKGIKFEDEVIRRKVGKAGAK